MRLMLMRHGIAEDAGPDTGYRDEPRALTDEGRARMAQAAEGLRALGVEASLVLTSPLVRCRQTADIVAAALGVAPVEDPRLRPGMELEDLADALSLHPGADPVLVCGHNPDLPHVVADLTGGGTVDFRKGSLAVLDVEAVAPRGGRLRGLYPPSALRAIAEL
ncbi:MAG TPA: histidine phosphatase family protein [Miltoncostaea sp.]|nr:histidine phosphatase family protein [Miltoncostaea sp.]